MGKKRDYGRVERFVWKDPRFHSLGADGKWVFLHLLSSPGAYSLPGLVHATPLLMLEWLNWVSETGDDVGAALKRVTAALASCVDAGWVQVDPVAKLVYLPRAFEHERPDNLNVLHGWVRELAQEVPRSRLRQAWILDAYAIAKKAFGREDSRTKMLRPIVYAVHQQAADDISFPVVQDAQKRSVGGPFADLSGSFSDPSAIRPGPCRNPSAGEQLGIIQEGETVPPGVGYNPPLAISISSNNSRGKVDPDPSCSLPIPEDQYNAGPAGSPPAAARPPARQRKAKPTSPPADLNPRQAQAFNALRTAVFYVPGVGDQTAWENVSDPVRLASALGGPGYPAVDVGLIHRLAAWTQEHRSRGKKKVGQFLLGRFSASQERGGQRVSEQADDAQRPRATADLAEKVRNTRK